MWHDSSRKGGEPFSLAGNRRTSLLSGLAAAQAAALEVEWEKREDATFPKAAEVRRPISHSHTHARKHTRTHRHRKEGGNDGLHVASVLVRRCVSMTT